MTVINTNVASLNAQAALASNARGLNKAMEQLSTGKRINSAADDAAGLAISTRLTSQIRGLNQAVRNANDGISLVQIGEGALVEVTNMMQRMRELAVQSANDTNTAGDRKSLNLEFSQLKSEINRIGSTVEWNGTKILDGTFANKTGNFTFQVGANANQTIDLKIGNMTVGAHDIAQDQASGALTSGSTHTDVSFAGSTLDLKTGATFTLKVGDHTLSYEIASGVVDSTASAASQLSSVLTAAATDLNTSASDLGVTGVSYAGSGTNLTITSDASFSVDVVFTDAGGTFSNLGAEDVKNQARANTAISQLDTALGALNDQRAKMGAVINRLQYTVNNLTNISTHSSEAKSRIEDTNYAQSTMDLAKSQIIQQAATAMLAQANQQPQQVLTLLK